MMNSYYVKIKNLYDIEINPNYLDKVNKELTWFNYHRPFIHGSKIVTIHFAIVDKKGFNNWTLLPYYNSIEDFNQTIQELNSFNEQNDIDWRIEKLSHSLYSLVFKTESEKILNRI